ncbi:EamA family transporter [Acinetobacter faecalis]|uniref:EamA family transporter n=1 Tax=Acinetobacter faecalis TaxID=2665161 RepID=UPI002A90F120|nr:EamA family transporter [Acinetobacter faecalis]MDY6523611.1 EamA family transporter [Acinetobacter faecalis]
MPLNQFILVLSAVILNSIAQLVLKAGTNALGILLLPNKNIVYSIFRILFQPYVFTGLVLYVVSFGVWIFVLSKLEVSVAYPLLSIGYLFSLILAWFFFGEAITFNKSLGILFLMIGTFFITR